MQYLCAREEMQAIDACSINEIGIPGIVLMERAALGMKEELVKRFPEPMSLLVVVEKGNNGGDGLALGRLLMAEGWAVTFYEIGGVPKATESYLTQKNILLKLGAAFVESMPEEDYDIVVDAIFGVGLKREVAGIQREVIGKMNRMSGKKVAVDVPSGVDASTGHILGCCFQADLTITFGLSKIGLVLYPGASAAGEVIVKDIGFPKEAVEKIGPSAFCYEKSDLCQLPQRKAWSHKGTYGKVLLIAGSKNMAGAAFLSGLSAYRSGSGLVRIFTYEENREILQTLLPEAIMTTYRSIEEACALLPEALSWATVVGMGPGLGQSEDARMLVQAVLQQGKVPLVVDADAINILAWMREQEEMTFAALYEGYGAKMILTPHLMEMSRLTGKKVVEIQTDPIETARQWADEQHIVVLKDARTIVSDGTLPSYINQSGNHGMAVGGSGDVLTGILCGFLAGGLDASEAARMAVYCHGLAGDAAAEEKGYYGLMAKDIAQSLCRVIH